ncbi:hypothetical protein H0H93_015542, partial [Arthromyces matolae]
MVSARNSEASLVYKSTSSGHFDVTSSHLKTSQQETFSQISPFIPEQWVLPISILRKDSYGIDWIFVATSMLAMRYIVLFTIFITSSTLAAVDEHNFDSATASLENVHVRRDGTGAMGTTQRHSAVMMYDPDYEGPSLPGNGPKHDRGSVVVYTVPTELVERVECTVVRFS